MREKQGGFRVRRGCAAALAALSGGLLTASSCSTNAMNLLADGLDGLADSVRQEEDEPTIGDFVDLGFSRLLEDLDP